MLLKYCYRLRKGYYFIQYYEWRFWPIKLAYVRQVLLKTCTKLGKWALMYLCVSCRECAYFHEFSTLWYFVLFFTLLFVCDWIEKWNYLDVCTTNQRMYNCAIYVCYIFMVHNCATYLWYTIVLHICAA
jgi:hypothetical protein